MSEEVAMGPRVEPEDDGSGSGQQLTLNLDAPPALTTHYDRAMWHLAAATRIDEVLTIKDQAEQLKFLGRQANDKSMQADGAELTMRAERKLGEMLAAAKDQGLLAATRPTKQMRSSGERIVLADIGIDRKMSHKAQSLAGSPVAIFEDVVRQTRDKILAGKAVVINPIKDVTKREKQIRRMVKEAQLGARAKALPTDVFQLILEDPEWKFETYSDEGLDRGAENHYPTSELATIKARPVSGLAAKDSVYFLWATVPMLPQALELMRFRGFEYKSHWMWDKEEAGTGYWNRNEHEILLVGIKGSVPAPAPGTQYPSILRERKGVHSAKPEISYQMIEAYFPTLKKIELNARRSRPGWTAWGNEAPEQDGPEVSAGAEEARQLDDVIPPAEADVAADAAPASHASAAGGEGDQSILPATITDATACAPVEPAKTEAGDGNGLRLKGNATLAHRGVGARESDTLAAGLGTSQREDGASPAPSQPDDLVPLTRAEAEPVLRAHYATSSGAEISAMLGGVPIGTIRTWAHRLGLTSRARIVASGQAWAAGQNGSVAP